MGSERTTIEHHSSATTGGCMTTTEDRPTIAPKTESVWRDRDRWVPRGVSTYAHVAVERAHGAEVWDVDGRHYLDFAGGIGTLNAGHTPEGVVEAVKDQVEKLIH